MDRIIDAANKVVAAANELCRVVRDAEAGANVPPKPSLNESETPGTTGPGIYRITSAQLLCLAVAAELASQHAPFSPANRHTVIAASQAVREVLGDA